MNERFPHSPRQQGHYESGIPEGASPMKPVIGITPSPMVDKHRGERNTLSINYSNAVLAAGGVPIILPPQTGNDQEILSIVDGLIFSGGGDIRPEIYGDQ